MSHDTLVTTRTHRARMTIETLDWHAQRPHHYGQETPNWPCSSALAPHVLRTDHSSSVDAVADLTGYKPYPTQLRLKVRMEVKGHGVARVPPTSPTDRLRLTVWARLPGYDLIEPADADAVYYDENLKPYVVAWDTNGTTFSLVCTFATEIWYSTAADSYLEKIVGTPSLTVGGKTLTWKNNPAANEVQRDLLGTEVFGLRSLAIAAEDIATVRTLQPYIWVDQGGPGGESIIPVWKYDLVNLASRLGRVAGIEWETEEGGTPVTTPFRFGAFSNDASLPRVTYEEPLTIACGDNPCEITRATARDVVYLNATETELTGDKNGDLAHKMARTASSWQEITCFPQCGGAGPYGPYYTCQMVTDTVDGEGTLYYRHYGRSQNGIETHWITLPSRNAGESPANLETEDGLYQIAYAQGGRIRHRRAPHVKPPFETFVIATDGPGDDEPRFVADERNRLRLVFVRGGNVLETLSDDDGETWNTPVTLFSSASHPVVMIDPRSGVTFYAAWKSGGSVVARRQYPGDTSPAAEFTASGLTLDDDSFSIAPAVDGAGRWLLVGRSGGDIKNFQSFDDGASWSEVS